MGKYDRPGNIKLAIARIRKELLRLPKKQTRNS